MTCLTPQQLADLWFLRFGDRWVEHPELDKDWVEFYKTLKRNGYMQYEAINAPNSFGYVEVARLKGD